MQTNVDLILAAANGTGLFSLVTDKIFDENNKWPALVITDRENRPQVLNSSQKIYFDHWRYTVHILERLSNGYTSLESLTKEFLKALLTGRFRVVEETHAEFLVSGVEILINTMVLEHIDQRAFV